MALAVRSMKPQELKSEGKNGNNICSLSKSDKGFGSREIENVSTLFEYSTAKRMCFVRKTLGQDTRLDNTCNNSLVCVTLQQQGLL